MSQRTNGILRWMLLPMLILVAHGLSPLVLAEGPNNIVNYPIPNYLYWSTAGEIPWTIDYTSGYNDKISLKSEPIECAGESDLKMNKISGPAIIRFKWKRDVGPGIGQLIFSVDGKKIIYYENSAGKMQEEATFKNDIKDGPSNWYTITGDKVAEYNYMNGNLEGMQRQYYPKSVLMSEQNYIKNVPQGEYKEYFESGKPKYQGIYVNGEKDGKWNEFDENGTIIKTSKFLKGVEK